MCGEMWRLCYVGLNFERFFLVVLDILAPKQEKNFDSYLFT